MTDHRSQISISTSPVASQHLTGRHERVIEFSSPVGGGLISFLVYEEQLRIHVYRQDLTVTVAAGEPGQPVRYGNRRYDAALYAAAKSYVTSYETRDQVTADPEITRVRDAEIRVHSQAPDTDDASDMYVMEVLGASALIRLVKGEGGHVFPRIMVETPVYAEVGVNEDINGYGEPPASDDNDNDEEV